MIQHPKALILDELQRAGIPSSDLHGLTERIAEAYREANREVAIHESFRPRFEFVTDRDEEETP